jgi:hypothetical protein
VLLDNVVIKSFNCELEQGVLVSYNNIEKNDVKVNLYSQISEKNFGALPPGETQSTGFQKLILF